MEMKDKIVVRGELALVLAVLINSFAVAVTVYAGPGISPVSSFPYAVSLVFPFLTLGTWTYLFQGVLVITLMVLRKRFVPSYLFSFVAGFFFGKLLDVFGAWLPCLPYSWGWRIFYFVASCPVIALGIALSNRCKLPIIPTDLFARDLSEIIRKPYAKVKTTMDLTCVAVSIVLTVVGTGTLKGVGIGTVVAALTYGRTAGLIGNLIDKKFYFVSVLEK